MSPSRSRNLLRYGPVKQTSLNDSVTVNEDGSLNITGDELEIWKGIQWDQDPAAFTPGSSVTLSCLNLSKNCEAILRFNGDASADGTLVYPERGDYKATGTVPSDVESVFLSIRRTGVKAPLTAANVKPMLNTGGSALPFEKPDVTNWGGGKANDLINLVINGDFTQNGDGWTSNSAQFNESNMGDNPPVRPFCTLAGANAWIEQAIAASKGARLSLSFGAFFNNGTRYVSVTVAGTEVAQMKPADGVNPVEWQTVSAEFTAPSDSFALRLTSKGGHVRLDNVTLIQP